MTERAGLKLFQTRAIERCANLAVPLYRIDNGQLTTKLCKVDCGTWACPDCAKKKARSIALLVTGMFNNVRSRHLVLTFPHGKISAEESFQRLGACWNRLLANLRKQFPKLKFFRAVEAQKSGHAHLHVIINAYIPHKRLSSMAEKAGFGEYTYIKEIQSDAQRSYTYKYLTKGIDTQEAHSRAVRTRVRRWSASKHPPLRAVSKKVWSLITKIFNMHGAGDVVQSLVERTFHLGGRIVSSRASPGGSLEYVIRIPAGNPDPIYNACVEMASV